MRKNDLRSDSFSTDCPSYPLITVGHRLVKCILKMCLTRTVKFMSCQKEISKELICSKPVFITEMRSLNIDIFQPRKDQCDLCFSFKQGNVSEEEYQQHITQKDRARQEKSEDKERAVAGEVCTYTMDVQAVQLIPSLKAGMIYFNQKLACYNFTIYSLADNKVVCYVWHEGEGGLDANCFASCLTDFLDSEVKQEDKI